jgi:hypothetical protein
MVGSFPGCCARAASGHAAATPPSSVMNSRQFLKKSGGHPTNMLKQSKGLRLRFNLLVTTRRA